MKYYTLEAVIEGKNIKFDKAFTSRKNAIDYMFAYYNKKNMYNLMVEEEYAVRGDKHDVEYVCADQYNRFRVSRIVLA